MTLFEALAALLILGVSAVGYLELFHGAGRSARNAEEWGRASAVAQSALEGATLSADDDGAQEESGFTTRIERRAWNPAASVTDVVVTVTTPAGGTLTVHRLMRTRR